ncbi:MAG: ester cyclase [Candidatus Limnocylindrales bacterium]
MNLETNKAIVRQFIERIFGAGDLAAVDELIAPDAVFHTYRFGADPRAGMRSAIERVSAGLSDGAFTVHELAAEGDLVCARVTSAATQTGTFMGMPPTGRRYEIEELHLFRVRDGKVAEHWHQYDQMGMMRQLGVGQGR